MNEIILNNLFNASLKYKNICINFNGEYGYKFIRDNYIFLNFDPCTQRVPLLLGLLGNIGLCRVFCSKQMQSGYISISNYEGPIIQSDKINWSPQLEIIYLDERYDNLKAFW